MNSVFCAFNCSLSLHVHLATSWMHCDMLAWSVLASDGAGPAINLGVVRVQVGRQTAVGNQRHQVGGIQDDEYLKFRLLRHVMTRHAI